MYFRKKEFEQASKGLKQQIELIEHKISLIKPGDIVCRKRGNNIFYSEITDGGEKGITRNKSRVQELVQIAYFEKQLDVLRNNSAVLDYCVRHYKDDSDKEIKELLMSRHRNLPVDEILFADSAKMKTEVYQKNPYYQENLKYITTNGVILRSKSEREIGNALESVGVEYDSDVLIQCGNARYYADFVIKRKNGTKLVWEHFGREHDDVYMAKNEVRIRDYISIGLRPWDNLVWTLDSDIEDSRTIRQIIQRFILSELDE